MAVAMGMGCFPLNALATDSFKEAEKVDCYKGYRNFLYRLCRRTGTIQNTSNIQLILYEEGSTMLNLASDTDLSRLNSVTLNMKNGFSKNSSAQRFDLNVNENKICIMICYVDVPASSVYINIPKLNEGYISR